MHLARIYGYSYSNVMREVQQSIQNRVDGKGSLILINSQIMGTSIE
jgi:hypothetical protein